MQLVPTPPGPYATPAVPTDLSKYLVVERRPTAVPGLSHEVRPVMDLADPAATPEALRDRDAYYGPAPLAPLDPDTRTRREFSRLDQDVVRTYLARALAAAGEEPLAIVEIGVNRQSANVDPEWCVSDLTSTHAFLSGKRPQDVYLGIDIEDKSYLDQPDRNIHTLRCDSADADKVRGALRALGVEHIDVLFIDGWHSVGQVLKEWAYTDMLRTGGVVLMHDTNAHPGPYFLLEMIDGSAYDVKKYFWDIVDWGMGAAVKR